MHTGNISLVVTCSSNFPCLNLASFKFCLKQLLIYHCVSQCVRLAYRWCEESVSGWSCKHRRQQIETEFLRFASIFFIDVAVFAVLSNHYHGVLHVDSAAYKNTTVKDKFRGRYQLLKGLEVTRKHLEGESPEQYELYQVGVINRSMVFTVV